ncbi:MAG: hypothetical protein ACE5OR_13225 [bacterium]
MDLVFQIIVTAIGAFLSVILAKFLIQNGRAIVDLGKKLDERTAKIAELTMSEGEKTGELIKSMSDEREPEDKGIIL